MKIFSKLIFYYVVLILVGLIILDFFSAKPLSDFNLELYDELQSFSIILKGVFEIALILFFVVLAFVFFKEFKLVFTGFIFFISSFVLGLKYFIFLLNIFLPSLYNSLPDVFKNSFYFTGLFYAFLGVLHLTLFLYLIKRRKIYFLFLGGLFISIITSLYYWGIIGMSKVNKIYLNLISIKIPMFWAAFIMFVIKTLVATLPVLILFYYVNLFFTEEKNTNVFQKSG